MSLDSLSSAASLSALLLSSEPWWTRPWCDDACVT
jgi:hypothetical protein